MNGPPPNSPLCKYKNNEYSIQSANLRFEIEIRVSIGARGRATPRIAM